MSRLTLGSYAKLNSFVSRNESLEWGTLRTGKVGISGMDYVPPVPDLGTVQRELTKFAENYGPTEKALDLFLWGIRAQLFWDSNKRTSLLAANKLLV
jgi:hypothetical protein